MTKILCISVFFFILLTIHFVTLHYPFIGLGLFLCTYSILCISVISEDKKEDKDLVSMLDNEDEIKTLIVKLYARLVTLKGDKNDN
jgi:hypothetical protein